MSGIYIKNMEMPKNCEKCLGFERCYTRGLFDPIGWCHIAGTELLNPNPPTDCPLVPVPPHGRLGDLDALARQVEHERFHHTHTDGLAARHHVAEYGHFLKAISDAPTVIEAEEVEA